MSRTRDTNTDMNRNSHPAKLSPTAVNAELKRLEDSKADRTFVEGKFEAYSLKHKFLAEKVGNMTESVSVMNKTLAATEGRSHAAKRIVKELKDEINEGHQCLHVGTLTNIKSDMPELKKDVRSWTKWWKISVVTFFGGLIVLGGTLALWFVQQGDMRKDMDIWRATMAKQGQSIENLESAQKKLTRAVENKGVIDIDNLVKAINDDLDAREKFDKKGKRKKK